MTPRPYLPVRTRASPRQTPGGKTQCGEPKTGDSPRPTRRSGSGSARRVPTNSIPRTKAVSSSAVMMQTNLTMATSPWSWPSLPGARDDCHAGDPSGKQVYVRSRHPLRSASLGPVDRVSCAPASCANAEQDYVSRRGGAAAPRSSACRCRAGHPTPRPTRRPCRQVAPEVRPPVLARSRSSTTHRWRRPARHRWQLAPRRP